MLSGAARTPWWIHHTVTVILRGFLINSGIFSHDHIHFNGKWWIFLCKCFLSTIHTHSHSDGCIREKLGEQTLWLVGDLLHHLIYSHPIIVILFSWLSIDSHWIGWFIISSIFLKTATITFKWDFSYIWLLRPAPSGTVSPSVNLSDLLHGKKQKCSSQYWPLQIYVLKLFVFFFKTVGSYLQAKAEKHFISFWLSLILMDGQMLQVAGGLQLIRLKQTPLTC